MSFCHLAMHFVSPVLALNLGFQTVSRELVQPPKEAVFSNIMDGKTEVNTDLTQVQKRQQVFGFISSETQQVIGAQMKQMIAKMDGLERRHYEQKITKLDKSVKAVHESGQRATMDELMAEVGLSPRLKDRMDIKA